MERHMELRPLKFLIILILLGMVAGCSSTRLAYNYLDWIIPWYIDDYIQLEKDQEVWFEQHMEAFLNWHRHDQLPLYIQFVEQLQQDMASPITVDLLKQHAQTVQDFGRNITKQAESDIVQLFLWLNQKQKQEFFENLSQKQQELKEKNLSQSKARHNRRRIKQTEKYLKRFIGKLTAAQKTEVETWAESLIATRHFWLKNRHIWQHQMQQVLNSSKSDSHKAEQLKQLLFKPESLWPLEYRNAIEHNQSLTLSLLVSIHSRLNANQKRHLQKRLGKLRDDFAHLSKHN